MNLKFLLLFVGLGWVGFCFELLFSFWCSPLVYIGSHQQKKGKQNKQLAQKKGGPASPLKTPFLITSSFVFNIKNKRRGEEGGDG